MTKYSLMATAINYLMQSGVKFKRYPALKDIAALLNHYLLASGIIHTVSTPLKAEREAYVKRLARQIPEEFRCTSNPGMLSGKKKTGVVALPKKTVKKSVEAKPKLKSYKYTGDVNAPEFLRSVEWKRLRVDALELYGNACMMCGRNPKDHGIVINVDHIKPRRLRPDLALTLENLQILCGECNEGKGNRYETDWRT